MHHATSRDGRENGMYDCLVGVSCTLKEGRLEKRRPFGKIDCERSAVHITLYVTCVYQRCESEEELCRHIASLSI
jgi:hypothetical protein